jgi:hypothetical protein
MSQTPDYLQILGSQEAIRRVQEFNERHRPQDQVDYKWLFDHAKALFADCDKDFDALDGKAEKLITGLGSGAGLVTIGSLAGLANGVIDARIVAALLPAFVLSLVSIGLALRARSPQDMAFPPSVESAVDHAHHYLTEDKAKGSLLGQWHVAVEVMRAAAASKAKWVGRATWAFFFAVCALIVPLAAAFCLPPKVAKPQPAGQTASAAGQKLAAIPSSSIA